MVKNNNQLTLLVLWSVLENNDDKDNEVNNNGNANNNDNYKNCNDDNPKERYS